MTSDSMKTENLEVRLLLDAIYHGHGYDFRHYSPASIKRRVLQFLSKSGRNHVSELIPYLLYDKKAFMQFVFTVSVTVTEMFRDPPAYLALRQGVCDRYAW